MALAQHIAAADGGDIAVGLVTGKLHGPAFVQWCAIGAGPDLGIALVLRCGEVSQGNAVAQLPEVVVADRGHHAQILGIGAVVVVQADTGVPGALVIHLQVDVHGPRALAFANQRHDLATWALVQRRQLALDLGEVRYVAFLQGRDIVTDLHRRIVLGTDHADPADLGFTDLQVDDAALDLLLRQLDVHRLVTLGLVAFLQSLAGALDIAQGLLRTKERIHRFLDIPRLQYGVAAHDVFVDVDQLGRRVIGQQRAPQHRQDQAATHRQPVPGQPRSRSFEEQMLHTAPLIQNGHERSRGRMGPGQYPGHFSYSRSISTGAGPARYAAGRSSGRTPASAARRRRTLHR